MKKGLCVIGLLIILTGCHRVPEFKDIALIDSIMPTLSTAQKIGQLNQVNGRVYSRERLIEMVQQGEVGCIMNVSDAFADSLQREAITHTGIPLLFARDMIHGYHAIYPIPLGQSCSWDTALVYEAARLSALEMRSHGLRWTFSPAIDVVRDPRWGRVAESYGEDTYLTSLMGAQVIRAYQSAGVAATA